ncbi:hypothetical protein [Nostoc sp.]|uniref:hypothetical protein n=1 Tax=Nostoc sp. TaxID=1180 RepID=UPI002FFC967E
MLTPHKTTATIALDSRLGLRNQPVCSISPSVTPFHTLPLFCHSPGGRSLEAL